MEKVNLIPDILLEIHEKCMSNRIASMFVKIVLQDLLKSVEFTLDVYAHSPISNVVQTFF